MSEPASNDGYINAGCNETYRRAVSKGVWGNPLASQGWNRLCSGGHVLPQLESNSGRFERTSVTVNKDGFIILTWPSFQESLQQCDSLRPQWANSLFSSFANQTNVERRFQSERIGNNVQSLLNAGAGVIERSQQNVIAVPFNLGLIRLSEDRVDIGFV